MAEIKQPAWGRSFQRSLLDVATDRQVPREPSGASPGAYAELIRQLFRVPSAVAIVSCGACGVTGGLCEGIATELAGCGKRVAMVPADRLLRMNPVPPPVDAAFVPGMVPNVWIWPPPEGQRVNSFESRIRAESGHWLDSLRQIFDSVLLDCTSVDPFSGGVEVAAMADAAVLAVESGMTTKQQVRSVQHALQLRGVRLAGSILISQR